MAAYALAEAGVMGILATSLQRKEKGGRRGRRVGGERLRVAVARGWRPHNTVAADFEKNWSFKRRRRFRLGVGVGGAAK